MTSTEQDRVSKREFISRVAMRSGRTVREVSAVYEAIFDELTTAIIADESVVLTGIGKFYRQDHKGHKVRFGREDVEDYPVLKFSASPSVNKRLAEEQMIEELFRYDHSSNSSIAAVG